MNRIRMSAVALGVFAVLATQGRAAEPQAAGFAVARLVVCNEVSQREPVGVAEKFPVSQKEVTAFLEATGVAAQTPVSFVWIVGGKEVRELPAKLEPGSRWRTWVAKSLNGQKGEWKVELRGADGKAVATAAFTVE